MEIIQLPALEDNYMYLCHDSGKTAVIDPSEAGPVLETLALRGWKLDFVWNTHHHIDHVGGNLELKEKTGCTILGAEKDAHRLPGVDVTVKEGGDVHLGGATARVLEIPGHTTGHIAYWFSKEKAVFCGDTLFTLGCGRLFEGTADQMHTSLSRLAALPGDTLVYCGHEYTLSNARFAVHIEPENAALLRRIQQAKAYRAEGRSTVPSTMGDELETNPFLRTHGDARRFADLRQQKDVFK